MNWLYGAFVPKDMRLQSLSNHQRFQFVLRQSLTTPGVYVKTALFSLGSSGRNTPPEWGGGLGAMPDDSVRATGSLSRKMP